MSKAKPTSNPNLEKMLQEMELKARAAEEKKAVPTTPLQEPVQEDVQPIPEEMPGEPSSEEKATTGAAVVLTVKPEDETPKFKDKYKGQIIFMRHDQIEDLQKLAKATNRGINEIGRLAMDFFLEHVRIASEDGQESEDA